MKKLLILMVVTSLLVGVAVNALAGDVEKTLSHDLSECGRIVRRIADRSRSGAPIADDIAKLRQSAETIHADKLLLSDRRDALTKHAAALGDKSSDRQNTVSSALLKSLDDLLSRLDAIGTTVTPSGMDNTPAYLVRLRPVLTIGGERIIVVQDGLPMGAAYTLNIDVITPNGTERVSSSQINGNLSVIGVASQKVATLSVIAETDDAETILFKEAISLPQSGEHTKEAIEIRRQFSVLLREARKVLKEI